jgi:hypothetical protein
MRQRSSKLHRDYCRRARKIVTPPQIPSGNRLLPDRRVALALSNNDSAATAIASTIADRVQKERHRKAKTTSAIYENSLGNDHLWIRKDEAEQLAKGILPKSVQVRLVRFHLVDNTRGEPLFWKQEEIKYLEMALAKGQLAGAVRLETKAGDRGFHARLRGVVEVKGDKVTRLDLVAKGEFWGEGPYTRGAPKGKFPFAVAFRLSDGKGNERRIPPGGARGNWKEYVR